MDNDGQLLEDLKSGSETAWAKAFQQLYPCLYAAARHPSAALSPTEAEDVAIETLTRLVAKVQQVKQFQELKALGATIAMRRAISLQRRKYAEKRGGNRAGSLEQLTAETGDHLEALASRMESLNPTDLVELSRLLEDSMKPLDELTRSVIRDYVLHGMVYKELARKHRISISAVGVTLHRGLKKLRNSVLESPSLAQELRVFLR